MATTYPKITACVVTYRHSDAHLAGLFNSIAKSDCAIDFIVVDNSPDTSIESMVRSFGFAYLHNPSNPGFGRSHNLGYQHFKESDCHFVLNPDVYFAKNVLSGLSQFLIKNTDVALVSPKVLYPNGSLQRLCKLLPNPLNLFARRFMPALSRYLDYNFELRWFNYDVMADIPYMSGCFMAIRSSAFAQVGGFDDRFFMYLEDTDLSRRLLHEGRLVFNPQYMVYHVFEKASYRNPRLLRAHIASAFYYFNKWGWVFDAERRLINRITVKTIRRKQNSV